MKRLIKETTIFLISAGLLGFVAIAGAGVAHAEEVPEIQFKDVDNPTPKELLIVANSICAGYYSAISIGEMGSIESLANQAFANKFSSAQTLAVRLFTIHSNTYKRLGSMMHSAYDLGGQIGGNIMMAGEFYYAGDKWTRKSTEAYCAKTRTGVAPP